jgi:hypothetical protein
MKLCQRTICGAKNLFGKPIYLILQDYVFATVKDQYNILKILSSKKLEIRKPQKIKTS